MRIGNAKITGLTERASFTGTQFQGGKVIGEEYRSKLIDPKSALDEFDQMRKVDPMVHTTMVAITAPLLAADTFIQPSTKNPSAEEKAWTDSLNDNLLNEMCCTFDGFLSHALLQYPFGFSLFEKVVKEDARGWLIDDLAPIMPRSIHKWVPAHGGLVGIYQRAFDPGLRLVANPDLEGQLAGEEPELEKSEAGMKEVFLPAYKLVRFTHAQEGSNYPGRSILGAAYRPYFLKTHAERFMMIALERQAVSIPIGKYPTKPGANDIAELTKFLRNIRAHENIYGLLREDQSVEMLNMAAGSVMDPMPAIMYWDQRIANLMLGMFIMTGQGQGATGSRALMDPQLDIFMLTEEAGAASIAGRVQKDILEPLTELTHGDKFPVPEMVMRPRRTVRLEVIIEALYKLAGESGLVKPFPELTSHILQAMDLPVPPERFQPEPAPGDRTEDPAEGGDPVPPEIGGSAGGGAPGTEPEVSPGPTFVEHVEPVKLEEPGAWRPARPLRGIEKFVAYAEIRTRTDDFEGQLAERITAWSVSAGQQIGEVAAQAPDELADVAVPGTDQLTAQVQALLFGAFGFGRKTVAQERVRQLREGDVDHQVRLRDAADNHAKRRHLMERTLAACHIRLDEKPSFVDSPADASKLVRQLARGLTSWAEGRVTDAAMQGAVQAASAGLVGADAAAVVSSAVSGLSTRLTLDKVREFVRPAFAKGRAFEAEQLRDRIAGVAYYSDRADDDVCNNCSTMDGSFGVSAGGVTLGTKIYYAALPPNPTCLGRWKCRCTMVYG